MLVFPRGAERCRAYNRGGGAEIRRKRSDNGGGASHGNVADRAFRRNIARQTSGAAHRHDLHAALRHHDRLHHRHGLRHCNGSHGRRHAVLHNGLCFCGAAVGHVQSPRQAAVYSRVYCSKCCRCCLCMVISDRDKFTVRGLCRVCYIHASALGLFKSCGLDGAAGYRRKRRIRPAALRCAQGNELEQGLWQPL